MNDISQTSNMAHTVTMQTSPYLAAGHPSRMPGGYLIVSTRLNPTGQFDTTLIGSCTLRASARAEEWRAKGFEADVIHMQPIVPGTDLSAELPTGERNSIHTVVVLAQGYVEEEPTGYFRGIDDPTYLPNEPYPVRITEYARALARQVYGIDNPEIVRFWNHTIRFELDVTP